jgi:hypothetical protein
MKEMMGFGGNAESHFCANRFALATLRAGLRRKECSLSFVYPALSPQRALRASGTYWANLSSRLTALHSRCYCDAAILRV